MARALNRAFPWFIVFFFFSYLLLRGILPSWREESRFTIHVNGTITLHALKTIIFPRYIFHVHPHVVHHFLESLFIFCTFEKPRGKFIRTIIPFDNRDRSIISNRKFPTRYHRSIVSIPPRYLHLFLHLRSSKLVKKKKKKNITRVEFAKIYDTGSFAKVARGDTVERGWRAFDKWIEITNYPRPFRRGFAFDKERGDWFLSEIERERSIVIIRTWTVAGFCAPRVSCTTRCSRSSARIDSRLLSYRSRAIDVTENRSSGGGGERRGMDFAFACGRACVGARA